MKKILNASEFLIVSKIGDYNFHDIDFEKLQNELDSCERYNYKSDLQKELMEKVFTMWGNKNSNVLEKLQRVYHYNNTVKSKIAPIYNLLTKYFSKEKIICMLFEQHSYVRNLFLKFALKDLKEEEKCQGLLVEKLFNSICTYISIEKNKKEDKKTEQEKDNTEDIISFFDDFIEKEKGETDRISTEEEWLSFPEDHPDMELLNLYLTHKIALPLSHFALMKKKGFVFIDNLPYYFKYMGEKHCHILNFSQNFQDKDFLSAIFTGLRSEGFRDKGNYQNFELIYNILEDSFKKDSLDVQKKIKKFSLLYPFFVDWSFSYGLKHDKAYEFEFHTNLIRNYIILALQLYREPGLSEEVFKNVQNIVETVCNKLYKTLCRLNHINPSEFKILNELKKIQVRDLNFNLFDNFIYPSDKNKYVSGLKYNQRYDSDSVLSVILYHALVSLSNNNKFAKVIYLLKLAVSLNIDLDYTPYFDREKWSKSLLSCILSEFTLDTDQDISLPLSELESIIPDLYNEKRYLNLSYLDKFNGAIIVNKEDACYCPIGHIQNEYILNRFKENGIDYRTFKTHKGIPYFCASVCSFPKSNTAFEQLIQKIERGDFDEILETPFTFTENKQKQTVTPIEFLIKTKKSLKQGGYNNTLKNVLWVIDTIKDRIEELSKAKREHAKK